MDGADGYLPNDRRHVFKFYGSYKFTDQWSFGWNSSVFTGRPMNATGRGYPPDGQYPTPGYGDTYWTCYKPTTTSACQWQRNDRGDAGRMPTTFNLGTSVGYAFTIGGLEARASLDIFNILNLNSATKLEERYELAEGTPNPYYGYAKQWQPARSVRFFMFRTNGMSVGRARQYFFSGITYRQPDGLHSVKVLRLKTSP